MSLRSESEICQMTKTNVENEVVTINIKINSIGTNRTARYRKRHCAKNQ